MWQNAAVSKSPVAPRSPGKASHNVPTLVAPRSPEKASRSQSSGGGFRDGRSAQEFFNPPRETQTPLQKAPRETWNHRDSEKVQTAKAQDRLFRAVWRAEDAGTPRSDRYWHPLDFHREEYYPGRDMIDGVDYSPDNDYQVRAINLPDFANPPPEHVDSGHRSQRLRQVLRQRYGGHPKLLSVFKKYTLTKPDYVFPKDIKTVLDQMGIKVAEVEACHLVNAVDKDGKGAMSFDEFADLIHGNEVEIASNVGGGRPEVLMRSTKHMTRTLVDDLVHRGPKLGKAFCEIDPERRYLVTKAQFANALATACNHISGQAIEYLWASAQQNDGAAKVRDQMDWREFMSQLLLFANENRPPTPCCVQSRKRQYDLLQRTAALTGGNLIDLDGCRGQVSSPTRRSRSSCSASPSRRSRRSTYHPRDIKESSVTSRTHEAPAQVPIYARQVRLLTADRRR